MKRLLSILQRSSNQGKSYYKPLLSRVTTYFKETKAKAA